MMLFLVAARSCKRSIFYEEKCVQISFFVAFCGAVLRCNNGGSNSIAINIGDCFVIISGFLLGPVYGGFAAAASIPGNLVQAGVGVVTAYIFSLMIDKVHIADLINQ